MIRRRTLRWVNRVRARDMGLPPLRRLPKGVRGDEDACVLGRCFPDCRVGPFRVHFGDGRVRWLGPAAWWFRGDFDLGQHEDLEEAPPRLREVHPELYLERVAA